jgi:hypothetical protein
VKKRDSQGNSNKAHNSERDATSSVPSAELPDTASQSILAHLGAARQTLSPRHIEITTQYLRTESSLLDLVTIQLYQQLIETYGEELDQQITSDTILTNIKNLVQERFDRDNLWEESAREIWSNLVLRAIQDMERDLGASVLDSLDWEEFNQLLFQYLINSQSVSISRRIRYFEEFHSQNIATRIVQDLNLSNQSLSTLKRLLGLRLPTSTIVAPATERNLSQPVPILEIPSELPIVSREDSTGHLQFSDQLQEDLWKWNASGIAYLRYHSKQNRNNYLEHYMTSAGDIEMLPWETVEQILTKFGLNAVKLHFILTAYTIHPSEPWGSPSTLKASSIVAELGWDKNKNSDFPTKYNQISGLAYALSCLLVKIVWMDGQGHTTSINTPVGKLWDILITPHGQFDWTTGRIERSEDVYITVRPGLWSTYFFNQVGDQAKEAVYQFGQLALKLLTLGAYHDELGLRLIIHLMLDARIRASDLNPHEYQVKTLLEAVLPAEDMQQVQTSIEKGHSLFERWNYALDLLAKLGWHSRRNNSYIEMTADEGLGFGFYVNPYPKWLDPEGTTRKPRGWVNTWLEQKVIIKPLTTQSLQAEV